MKNLNPEFVKDLLNEFALSNEEMINVRGGEGETNCYTNSSPDKNLKIINAFLHTEGRKIYILDIQ